MKMRSGGILRVQAGILSPGVSLRLSLKAIRFKGTNFEVHYATCLKVSLYKDDGKTR